MRRQAARLVQLELADAKAAIVTSLENGRMAPLPPDVFRTAAWGEYQALLVGDSQLDWLEVARASNAVRWADHLHRIRADALGETPVAEWPPLSEETRNVLKTHEASIDRAITGLLWFEARASAT
jgi:hypothetical protein